MLFYGYIPSSLQYIIPYIHFRDCKSIYEPFRIRKSFSSFYREFRGSSKKDVIIRGSQRPGTRDHILQDECERFGLNCIDAIDFIEPAKELLVSINDVGGESNLGRHDL